MIDNEARKQPMGITAAEIAAEVQPKPGAVLVLGRVGAGKTLALNALSAAFAQQGSKVTTVDDLPALTGLADLSALHGTAAVGGDDARDAFRGAQVVIVFELWGHQAAQVFPFLKNDIGHDWLHMPAELMVAPRLTALVFRRSEAAEAALPVARLTLKPPVAQFRRHMPN